MGTALDFRRDGHSALPIANGPATPSPTLAPYLQIDYQADVPIWILALGGAGIVVGLACYGEAGWLAVWGCGLCESERAAAAAAAVVAVAFCMRARALQQGLGGYTAGACMAPRQNDLVPHARTRSCCLLLFPITHLTHALMHSFS